MQVLVTLAALLAGVAGVANTLYWRRVATGRSAATPVGALEAQGGRAAAPAPADDRAARVVALSQHLAQHPYDRRARLALAELYFKLKDYPRALAELHRLERDVPKDPEVLLRRAVVLKYARRPEEAAQALRRALVLKSDYTAAREWLGEVYLDLERHHQALAVFERCLKERPDSYFALMGKGRALEQLLLSRHPIPLAAVLEPVEKAVRLNPERPEGLTTLARMTFAYRNRLGEAEQLARRAAARDPEAALPHILLAQIALARPPTPENLQRAGEHAYEAGRRDRTDPRPPYVIGRVALQQNDLPRAIQALSLSLALGPMPETVTQLSAAYRRAGDEKRAAHYAAIFQRYTDLLGRRNVLLAARERQPGQIAHYYALAELYLEAGQPQTAEQWLNEARRLRPRDPRGDRLMARVRQLRKEGGDDPMLPIP